MKSNGDIKFYSSKQDYLKRSPTPLKKGAQSILDKGLDKKIGQASDKVELSSQAKQKSKGLIERVKGKVSEGANASKKLIGEAGGALKKTLENTALVRSLPIPSIDLSSSESEIADTSKVQDKKPVLKTINRPGIFFITDFSINPFSDDSSGLSAMASNIPTAEVFNWDEEDTVLDKILTRPRHQPILLVGHGMGGDAVVSISDRLNNIENGYRNVDLAVTLDSVGFDNDIIPQNVKENLNIISDDQGFFNDGPNIARKKTLTKVSNELRSESHDELEESSEVQFMIFDKISQVLGQKAMEKNMEQARLKAIIDKSRGPLLKSNP